MSELGFILPTPFLGGDENVGCKGIPKASRRLPPYPANGAGRLVNGEQHTVRKTRGRYVDRGDGSS